MHPRSRGQERYMKASTWIICNKKAHVWRDIICYGWFKTQRTLCGIERLELEIFLFEEYHGWQKRCKSCSRRLKAKTWRLNNPIPITMALYGMSLFVVRKNGTTRKTSANLRDVDWWVMGQLPRQSAVTVDTVCTGKCTSWHSPDGEVYLIE